MDAKQVIDRIVQRNQALWELLHSEPSAERAAELLETAFGNDRREDNDN